LQTNDGTGKKNKKAGGNMHRGLGGKNDAFLELVPATRFWLRQFGLVKHGNAVFEKKLTFVSKR
jgi:hypothetical protein